MKKIILIFITFVSFSCNELQKTSFSTVALDEKLLAVDDSEISFQDILNKHKGKTIVIEVWASWCGDCVKSMPKLKTLQANHPEVDYVFISMDKTADKWKAGVAKHKIQGDHYMAKDQMKGIFGQAIDLDWIPRYIIINKDGKILLYRAIEKDFATIDETLNNLK